MLKANKLYDCNHRRFKSGPFFKSPFQRTQKGCEWRETTIYACSIKCWAAGVRSLKCRAVVRYVSTNRILIQLRAQQTTRGKKTHNKPTPNTKSAHNHKLKSYSEFSCKYPWNYKFSYFFYPKKCVFGVKLRHGNKHLEIEKKNKTYKSK